MIRVRATRLDDLQIVADNARQADKDEMQAAAGATVMECLQRGYAESLRCWSICDDDHPIAVVGDVMTGIGHGLPWMVTTDDVPFHARGFLRASRAVLANMLERHSTLSNMVDDRNKAAIRWLSWLGFEIGEPVPAGHLGLPFRSFRLVRGRD